MKILFYLEIRSIFSLCLAGFINASICNAQSNWQEANKLVEAIGGWRFYAKEKATPPKGYPSIPSAEDVIKPTDFAKAPFSVKYEASISFLKTIIIHGINDSGQICFLSCEK